MPTSDLTAAVVADRLGLDDSYRDWLTALARCEPATPAFLPPPSEADALLTRLGVRDDDRGDVVEVWPSAQTDPELWWLVERCRGRVLAAMGDGDAAIACPSLPAALGLKGRCFWIFVYAATVDDARRWHREHGVPNHVSWATLADLGQQVMLHRRRHGTTGLDLQWWLVLHFTGAIYELGRLQFHMHHLFRGPAGPPFWPDADEVERLGPGFRAGDAALGIHIPEHGHLTPESCDESFAMARDFFATHFPEHRARLGTCTSWLLDEQLADYLRPTSNIVRLQRRFHLAPGAADDSRSTLRLVFDRVPKSVDELPQRTTLEKAIVEHIRGGGTWRTRTGWVEL